MGGGVRSSPFPTSAVTEGKMVGGDATARTQSQEDGF